MHTCNLCEAVCSSSGIFHMPCVDSLDEIIPHHCSTHTHAANALTNEQNPHTHTHRCATRCATQSHLSRPMRKVAQCSASASEHAARLLHQDMLLAGVRSGTFNNDDASYASLRNTAAQFRTISARRWAIEWMHFRL